MISQCWKLFKANDEFQKRSSVWKHGACVALFLKTLAENWKFLPAEGYYCIYQDYVEYLKT